MTSKVPPPPATPGPILTFLSSSPTHSRQAVHFLNQLFNLPQVSSSSEREATRRDCLDEFHFGSLSHSWDSVACACPTSGTILHFLSFSADKNNEPRVKNEMRVNNVHPSLQLIAIHGSDSASISPTSSSQCSEEQYHNALIECRQRLATTIQNMQIFDGNKYALASTLEARLRGLFLYIMCDILGWQPNPAWILAKKSSPILDLMPFSPKETSSLERQDSKNGPIEIDITGKLRELALPFFPGVSSSLQTVLSKSSLIRPLPGLYQCPAGPTESKATTKRNTTANPGLIFRPLPAAQEDLRLSSPSLVFQCESLVEAQKLVEEKLGGRTFKIGWRGHGQLGSLIVGHPSILGLDIRICEAAGNEWILSSSFDEAQESLLAGSLAELQSTHVVSEGKSGAAETSSGTGDTKNGNADCWVEFRSNVKHPTGFFKQFTSSLFQKPARTKVAKPPDIPYE